VRAPHAEMRERVERIGLQRQLGMAAGAGDTGLPILAEAQEHLLEMGEGETAMRAREMGVARDGGFEQDPGACVVGRVEAEHVVETEMIAGPGIEFAHGTLAGAACFLERDLQFERRYYAGSDLLPQPVLFAGRAFIPFSPYE